MSDIGYYRIKLKPEQSKEVTVYSSNIEYCKINVNVKENIQKCSESALGNRYIKYLDKYGRYRFWMFNNKWKEELSVQKIGSYNNQITSILDAQSGSKNIGSVNSRLITLRSEAVTDNEREVLSQVFVAPRVYLRIGNGDKKKDWLLIDVSGDNTITDKTKTISKFELTITTPEYYSIKG